MKLGWVDQLMGRVDHTKYFWPGVTLVLVGAHPNFEVTKNKPQSIETEPLANALKFFLEDDVKFALITISVNTLLLAASGRHSNV